MDEGKANNLFPSYVEQEAQSGKSNNLTENKVACKDLMVQVDFYPQDLEKLVDLVDEAWKKLKAAQVAAEHTIGQP